MLSIQQLNQFYGESHTLWDLDIQVPEGECTVLMGRNGVGKTTLLKCIMGLLKIRSGEMLYQGQSLTSVSAEKRAAIGIGFAWRKKQRIQLLSEITSQETVRE